MTGNNNRAVSVLIQWLEKSRSRLFFRSPPVSCSLMLVILKGIPAHCDDTGMLALPRMSVRFLGTALGSCMPGVCNCGV